MSTENKDIVRSFFETQDRELRTPLEFLSPDFVAYMPGSPPLNAQAFDEREGVFFAAFSDIRHVIDDLLAEQDRVAIRLTLEMTHTGDFMGIPVSNTAASVGAMGIMRIADGKIAEFWGLPDVMSLMQQISSPPATEPTAAG